MQNLFTKVIGIAICCTIIINCGGSGNSQTSPPKEPEPTNPNVPEPPSTPALEYALTVNRHAQNTLMATVTITTNETSNVAINYHSNNDDLKTTYLSESATSHQFTLVGLRASTEYQISAQITGSQSQTTTSDAQSFTTGALPDSAPRVELLANQNSTSAGITFFASTQEPSRFYGVDSQGHYVWYFHQDVAMSGSPTVKVLDNGHLMLMLSREVRIIDITGETLASYPLPAYHHDAVMLSNGNLLVLTNETQRHNGEQLKGDNILEVTSQGETVWQWSSFDHLDVTRFPGALANRVNNGQKDWTHANSLFYIQHDDAIMLSSRSQSWIVNINRTTNNVEWVLGDAQGTSPALGLKFFSLTEGSWIANQHAAMLTNLGEVLIYDNRNEAELAGNSNNSRGVRYNLNTNTMEAQQTWQYIAPKYTQSLGDIDELSNGNILLTAGGPGTSGDAHLIEVDNQSPASEIWHLSVLDTPIYRAERMPWSMVLAKIPPTNSTPNQPSLPPSSGVVNANGTTMLQVDNCPQASHFVNTSDTDNYIDYNLDGQTNADLYGDDLTPSIGVSCDNDSITVTSNGATNFDWINLGQGTASPNAGSYQWVVPRDPKLMEQTSSIPLLGVVGFTVTGVQIFGPNENAADNYADPVTDGLLNYCGGHTRDYHFHERAKCFFEWETLGGATSLLPAQTAEVVIGYALDGFEIRAPYVCSDADCTSAIKIESSYRYIGTGDYANEHAWDNHLYEENLSPLDACNGMIDSQGNYAYYATDTFPYYMGCYRGPTDYVSTNNPRFGR